MKKVIISKNDLKNNLEIINSLKNSASQIIGVVKANGMGLDLIQYSKFLVENDIKILAAATPDEVFELRKNNIAVEILLLTPTNDECVLEELIEKEITLTVSTLEQIEKLINISKKIKSKINIHIKIDSGFGRYGFLYTEHKKVLEIFKMKEYLNIKGIYTHFSNSIETKYTKIQFERFMKMIDCIKKIENEIGIVHCCNSTAFIKYPEMHLDAVRLGSIIQGRTLIKVEGLKRIGQFISSISEIKELPKGYNIGYGNTFKTKRDTKIAIIPVGHADGFETRNKRDNFNFVENIKSIIIEIKKIFKKENAKVKIKNKKYKIIGRIGLNHSVIDITNSDDIKISDKVILFENLLKINNQIRREYT